MEEQEQAQDLVQWLWSKLHAKHQTAGAAFEDMQDKHQKTAFENTKWMFGLPDQSKHSKSFGNFIEGKRHYQSPSSRREEVKLLHSSVYPFRLLADEQFRMYEAGRHSNIREQISAEEMLLKINDLRDPQVDPEWTLEHTKDFIAKFDTTPFLLSDGWLQLLDFQSFFELGQDPTWACMGTVARLIVEEEGRTVPAVKAKVAKQQNSANEQAARKRRTANYEQFITRKMETLIMRLRLELQTLQQEYDAKNALAEPFTEVLLDPVRMHVHIPPKPSLKLGMCALDTRKTGRLSLSNMRLAMLQFGIPLTSSETFLLGRACMHPTEIGAIDWLQLLEVLGVDVRPASVDAEEFRYSDRLHKVEMIYVELRKWEIEAKDVLQEYEKGVAEPGDVATMLVFEPQMDVKAVRTCMRRYSMAQHGHPLFNSPCANKLTMYVMPAYEALFRILTTFDRDLLGTATEKDLVYAFKCAGVQPPCARRMQVLMETFAAPPADGLASTQAPMIHYEALMRAISPSRAELWLERQEMQVDADNEHYDEDLDAILSSISAGIFPNYLKLIKCFRDQDVNRTGSIGQQQLIQACKAAGMSIDYELTILDAQWAIHYFHSDFDKELVYELLLALIVVVCDRKLPFANDMSQRPHRLSLTTIPLLTE